MKLILTCVLLSQLLAVALIYAGSPYAPEKVGTAPYGSQIGSYDYATTGNRLSNGYGQIITMGLIPKPETITTASGTETFRYRAGGRRFLRVHADGRKTLYLEGMEYRIPAPDDTSDPQSIVRIYANGYSPVVQVNVADIADPEYTYLVRDHLGSPVIAVDATGVVRQRNRFEAWGQMIEATGVAKDLNNAKDVEGTRGYTGHELIASANFGHWNNRVFDYELGMFLGPDKFIQGRSIASLNRYALGHNSNPNVVDPSGWIVEGLVNKLAGANYSEEYSIFSKQARKTMGGRQLQALVKIEQTHLNERVTAHYTFSREPNARGRGRLFGKSADSYVFRDRDTGETIVRFELSKMKNKEYLEDKLRKLDERLTHPDNTYQKGTDTKMFGALGASDSGFDSRLPSVVGESNRIEPVSEIRPLSEPGKIGVQMGGGELPAVDEESSFLFFEAGVNRPGSQLSIHSSSDSSGDSVLRDALGQDPN